MSNQEMKIGLSPVRLALVATLAGLLLWLPMAEWIVPGLIRDGWNGEGVEVLNRFFASRSSKKSLGYYQDLWVNLKNAIYGGFLAYAVLLFQVRKRIENQSLQIALILLSGLFLTMTILWGPRQDYVAHMKIWEMIRSGDDPWWIQPDSGIILNAYGPLFNLLAWPAMISTLAPKTIFAFSYLFYCIYLVSKTIKRRSGFWMTCWCFSPFFWLEIAFYGHFDVLVALMSAGAFILKENGMERKSGLWLGLGFLLKFIPIIFLPFLVFDRSRDHKLHFRLLVSCVITMFTGMAMAWMIWGESSFRPLLFASSRGSSLISFWRFIKGAHSPIAMLYQPVPDLDFMATPVLLLVLAGVWLFYMKFHLSALTGSLIAMLAVLIFYRVGFLQYQMVFFLILPIWFLNHMTLIKQNKLLKWALLLYFMWISFFDLFDNAVGGIIGLNRPYGAAEEWAGLPQLVLGGLLMIALLRTGNMKERLPAELYHQNAPMKKVK